MAYLNTKDYIGKYRVKAHYDLESNDFPRDAEGNIDKSFDDFYIDCHGKIQVYHKGGQTLTAYIPAKGKGRNVLRAIYINKTNCDEENLPSIEEISDYLLKEKSNKILSIVENDEELEFDFNSKDIEYFMKFLKPKTGGVNVKPLSEKNLEWIKYEIPEEDNKRYKQAIEEVPVSQINSIYSEFAKKNKIDLNAERKRARLKNKDYIHSLGLWNKLIKFIDEYKKSLPQI